MLFILFSWIIITFIFLSFGNMTMLLWNKLLKREDRFSLFDCFWLGLCAVGVLLMTASLVASINIYVSLAFITIPLLYWGFNLKKGNSFVRNIFRKIIASPIYATIAIIIAALVILLEGTNNMVSYDTGLYYLQTMKWNEQYSIVPGLGNLHSRLGFNSTFLLLSTLFYHPSQFFVFFPLNSLCVFVVVTWIIRRICETNKLFHQLALFAILYIVFRFYFTALSSLMTDVLPNFILIYLLLSCALKPQYLKSRSLVLCVLSVFCITLKLSLISICIIPLIVLFTYLRHKEYKHSIALSISMALIVIPWCIRFVILTGYLIYPFPSIDIFSVDWKMPYELAELEKTVVGTWARMPGTPVDIALNTPISEWIGSWFGRMRLLERAVYILSLLSPIAIFCFYKKWEGNRIVVLMWLIAFSGSLLNFLLGPELRFSMGFLAICSFIPLLLIRYDTKFTRILLPVLLTGFFVYQSANTIRYQNLVTRVCTPESIDQWIDREDMFFYEYTVDGTVIYSTNPIGENPRICYEKCNNQCYDQGLPCTPYLNNGLEMRGKTLQEGFRIKEP